MHFDKYAQLKQRGLDRDAIIATICDDADLVSGAPADMRHRAAAYHRIYVDSGRKEVARQNWTAA